MKRHDAFAFRDFDVTKILQRPFFRQWREKYHVGDASDDEILATLTVTDSDDTSTLEEKNSSLMAISDGLSDLCDMIQQRHANYQRGRLETYRRRLMKKIPPAAVPPTAQTILFQSRIARQQNLLGFYTVTVLPSLNDLIAFVAVLLAQSDKLLQAAYRKRFGERLKALREAAGLTRQQVAHKLNLTLSGYSYYERGERELTILAITRLSKILKISIDELFGLK